jgi:hypothetical protein
MGIPRTIGAVLAVAGTPTPVYTGTPQAVASFSIKKGIATVVLQAALPDNGFTGPNDTLQPCLTPANGQQVTLWAFGTATYFNGKVVSVISHNRQAQSFSFYFNHADVASTADTTGKAAASPFQHYRAVRIECGAGLASDIIYVGDLNVSSTRYMAALSLTGQLSIEIASENIPADRIFIDTNGTGSGDTVQVTLIY